MSIKRIFCSLVIPLLLSCSGCATPEKAGTMIHKKRNSIGLISSKTFITITTKPFLSTTSTTSIKFSTSYSTSGTGTVVRHNEDTSFVLTAAHVCTLAYERQVQTVFPFYNKEQYEKAFLKLNVIYDVNGKGHPAIPLVWSKAYDICIMVSLKIPQPALKIAIKAPFTGEKSYYMGFPRGIGGGPFVPAFDGYYLGEMRTRGMQMGLVSGYSFPIAPGSSGSAVLNSSGDIIGVIHSYIPAFGNIGMSATYGQVEELFKEADKAFGSRRDMIVRRLKEMQPNQEGRTK